MAHELRVEGDKVIESDAQGHVVATKGYSHVHAGYVATTHNPRVSDAAKHDAERILHDLEAAHGEEPASSVVSNNNDDDDGKAQQQQQHVATTDENPHDTRSHDHPEQQQHEPDDDEDHAQRVHRHRQIGGFKATLKREGVSDEAKQHARDMLYQLGVPRQEYD